MKKPPKNLVQRRPAETATPVAMAVSLLIAKAVGVTDADTVAYIAFVVGFLPAGITWLVELARGR